MAEWRIRRGIKQCTNYSVQMPKGLPLVFICNLYTVHCNLLKGGAGIGPEFEAGAMIENQQVA